MDEEDTQEMQAKAVALHLKLLALPLAEHVSAISAALEETYYEGYESGLGHGYSNGVAQGG